MDTARFPIFLFATSVLAGGLAFWAALAEGPDAATIRSITFVYWVIFLPVNVVMVLLYARARRAGPGGRYG